MGQITFKMPDEEIEFLKYVSKQNGSAFSSIYRDKTITYYKQWKIEYLLTEYERGSIGFKTFCRLGNLSPLEGMIAIENSNIDPKVPEIIDEYTSKKRGELKPVDLFKKGEVPKRKSPEIFFSED